MNHTYSDRMIEIQNQMACLNVVAVLIVIALVLAGAFAAYTAIWLLREIRILENERKGKK